LPKSVTTILRLSLAAEVGLLSVSVVKAVFTTAKVPERVSCVGFGLLMFSPVAEVTLSKPLLLEITTETVAFGAASTIEMPGMGVATPRPMLLAPTTVTDGGLTPTRTVAVPTKFVPKSVMVRVKLSLPVVELVSVNLLNAVLITVNWPVSVIEVVLGPAIVNPEAAVVFNKPLASLTTTDKSELPAPLSEMVRPVILVALPSGKI